MSTEQNSSKSQDLMDYGNKFVDGMSYKSCSLFLWVNMINASKWIESSNLFLRCHHEARSGSVVTCRADKLFPCLTELMPKTVYNSLPSTSNNYSFSRFNSIPLIKQIIACDTCLNRLERLYFSIINLYLIKTLHPTRFQR